MFMQVIREIVLSMVTLAGGEGPCASSFESEEVAAAAMCSDGACCFLANGLWTCYGWSETACSFESDADWQTCPSGMCYVAGLCRFYAKDGGGGFEDYCCN